MSETPGPLFNIEIPDAAAAEEAAETADGQHAVMQDHVRYMQDPQAA